MEDDAVVEARISELDDVVRRPPGREVEELENHLAEPRDLHAEAPVPGENRGGDEGVARLHAIGERPVPLGVQNQQERRTSEERNVADRRKRRLRESRCGNEDEPETG